VLLDEAVNLIPEIFDAREYPSIYCSAFQLTKPTFNRIQPGCAGWRKVEGEPRVGLEPFHHFCRFMGTAVVQNDMEVNLGWNASIYLPQEVEKLLGSMSFGCSPDYCKVEFKIFFPKFIAPIPDALKTGAENFGVSRSTKQQIIQYLELSLFLGFRDHVPA
jgi:hypothetical protein